MHRQTDK